MAISSARVVQGGFGDPVFASQEAFRAIMNAFAQPGTVADVGSLADGLPGLTPSAGVLLLTLADGDTPIFVEGHRIDELEGWLAFHTGAVVVSDPASAVFALLLESSDPAGWNLLPMGSETYPDRSATLILPVDGFGDGEALILAGPGIEARRTVTVRGLPEDFLSARTRNAALFPRGQDLVLVAGSQLMALPRTTRIERA